MARRDEFKLKAILMDLKKTYPQLEIEAIEDFQQYGYDQGIAIAVKEGDKTYYRSNYEVKIALIKEVVEEMYNELKKDIKTLSSNPKNLEKFILDQIALTHVKDNDIFEYDAKHFSEISTMGIVTKLIERYDNVEDIMKYINNVERKNEKEVELL